MRCCCGSDIVPGHLIHGVTIHLKYWAGLLSAAVSRLMLNTAGFA
jgi:hypothetical protein